MARNKNHQWPRSQKGTKKSEKAKQDAGADDLTDGGKTVDKGENPANAPEEEQGQKNTFDDKTKLLVPFNKSITSGETDQEELFKYCVVDTDPGKIGPLIAMAVLSSEKDVAIKLMSDIYERMARYVIATQPMDDIPEFQGISGQGSLFITGADPWNHPPSLEEANNKTVNMYAPHTEITQKRPSQNLAILKISQTQEYKKQSGKPQKLHEGSEEALKNYTESEDTQHLLKNLYFCKSEEFVRESKKNLFYISEDSDINMSLQYLVSEDEEEDETEMFVLYQNSRHILLLVSRKADQGPVVQEMVDLMFDDSKRRPQFRDIEYSKKHSERNLIIDQKPVLRTWIDDARDALSSSGCMQKLKLKVPDVEEFEGKSIDKNFPKLSELKRKSSSDSFPAQEGCHEDGYGGWYIPAAEPLGKAYAIRMVLLSVSSLLISTGGGGTSGQELYSSHSEGSNEEDTDASGDAEESSDCETCSSSQRSLQQTGEESDEHCLTSAEDEQSTDDKLQHDDELSEDVLHSHRSGSPSESLSDEHTAVSQTESSPWTPVQDIGSGVARSNIQVGTEEGNGAEQHTFENRTGSKDEPGERDMATGTTHEDVENGLTTDGPETDVPSTRDRVRLTHPVTQETLLAQGSAAGERRGTTPLLSTPVQVSSPTQSEHTIPAYPGYLLEPNGDNFISFPYDENNAIVYGSSRPSVSPQLGSQHLPSAGACGGHTPVAAEEERYFHMTTHPEDESGPFVTEETIFSFTSRHGSRPTPARSARHVHTHPHCLAQETPPTQSVGQSESESQSYPAPERLPPITVHAAGAIPPWATTTARIDLSQATNREFAQLRGRRATFSDGWLSNSGIDPANMALAGFFRIGLYRISRANHLLRNHITMLI